MTTNNLGRWGVAVIGLLVLALLCWWYWPRPREAVYSLYRERGRSQALAAVQGYHTRSGQHVTVHYTDQDENIVDWVIHTTDTVYEPVVNQVGYNPPEKVQIIIYPTRSQLQQAFGWSNGESAMGVYWTGTIRLLSPNVWIDENGEKERRKAFERLNPIAHELTHYALDYLTNGNYPHWFTEGLAQRVEYNITGYLWIEDGSTLRQSLYTLDDLEQRFETLDNQPLAYRESFLLVDFIANQHGVESLHDLVRRLGAGTPFSTAVQQVTGHSKEQLFTDWNAWVKEHLNTLEPTG